MSIPFMVLTSAIVGVLIGCLYIAIDIYLKSKKTYNSPSLAAIEETRKSSLYGSLFIDESSGDVYADFHENPMDLDAEFVALEIKRINREADISAP